MRSPPPPYRDEAGQAFDFDHEELHYDTPEADRHVTLIIKDCSDAEGRGVRFQIRYLDSFKNAFDHFKAKCCATCKPKAGLRFKLGGQTLTDVDTPKKLRMYHATTVEIRVYSTVKGLKCPSCKARGYPKSTGIIVNPKSLGQQASARAPRVPSIKLLIRDQTGYEMSFRMPATSTMEMLMEGYCDQARREMKGLRFYLDDERIIGDETPDSLEPANDDIIMVFVEQRGGRVSRTH